MAQIDRVVLPAHMGRPVAGQSLGGITYVGSIESQKWKFEPHEWIALLTPLVGGLLAAGAAVFALRGQEKVSTVLLSSWGIITAIGGAAMVLRDIEERRETQALIAQINQPPAPPEWAQGAPA